MMRPYLIAFALVGMVAPALSAGAQELRTLQAARQLSDSQPVRVDVSFAAGKFSLHPIDGGLLYQMRLRYDERATDAVHQYDAEDHSLSLGIERGSASFGIRALRGGGHNGASELEVGLTRAVPIELSVQIAGTESTLELGGLLLTKLDVNCAASGATLSFASPNRAEMENFSVHVAAAGAKIENLGNANAANVRVQGAAGGLQIDFGKTLMRDVTVQADLALGALEIVVPQGVGLMVRARSRLGSFDASGLNKVGDAWYSDNWNQATRKVTVEATTVLSNFELTRTAP